jgi:hypothetical protein
MGPLSGWVSTPRDSLPVSALPVFHLLRRLYALELAVDSRSAPFQFSLAACFFRELSFVGRSCGTVA